MSRLTTRISYEWVVETKDEYDDIIDCDFSDEFPGDVQNASTDVALVRYVGEGLSDDFDNTAGEVDRQYAYLNDAGQLPDRFPDGIPVPQRFHKAIG